MSTSVALRSPLRKYTAKGSTPVTSWHCSYSEMCTPAVRGQPPKIATIRVGSLLSGGKTSVQENVLPGPYEGDVKLLGYTSQRGTTN